MFDAATANHYLGANDRLILDDHFLWVLSWAFLAARSVGSVGNTSHGEKAEATCRRAQDCLAGWSCPTAPPNKRLEHDTNNNRTGFAPGDVLHQCSARHAVLRSFDLDVECATTRPTEMTQRTTCTIEYEIHLEFFVCEAVRTAARQQDTMQKIASVHTRADVVLRVSVCQ